MCVYTDESKRTKVIIQNPKHKDYVVISGKLMPVTKKILELKPDQVIQKTAVCDVCHEYSGLFTQILNEFKQPVVKGLPSVVPDNGAYIYEARCRGCFVSS